jgi:hypothetical protein
MSDSFARPFPDTFPVSVIVEYRKARDSRWEDGHWQVSGVVAGSEVIDTGAGARQLHALAEGRQYLWSGLRVQLHRDDAASYYFNLVSDNPRVFIICREEVGQAPRPLIATLSYAEATSYMETDAMVESVDMPAELYHWAERFVLEHYVPEKRKKRKRENWKAADNEPAR